MIGLEIGQVPKKGRGVFASRNFKKGEIIETAPVIVLRTEDSALCEKTLLDTYLFGWTSNKDGALVLGYGSLYNHSFHPNAIYEQDYKNKCMIYIAYKNIRKGDEILINYNKDPEDRNSICWLKKVY